MLHPYAEYWDKGESNVPDMTGAKHLLDGRDLRAIFAAFEIPVPFDGHLVDVGCGTGRMGQLLSDPSKYWGFDIAPSAVAYCRAHGFMATLVTGPSFRVSHCDLLTAISVFTHIDREERQRYLNSFWLMSPRILVDIIPGDGTGNVALWTANHDHFVDDLNAAGFTNHRWVDQAWDMHMHRYFYAERA